MSEQEPSTDGRARAPSGHGPGQRLESWKEIAAYLRRDVRTVQRWEQTDALPIHRHQRAHRPIPYAYTAELDAWWTGRSNEEASAKSPVSPSQPRRRRPLVLAVAMLASAALAIAAAVWSVGAPTSSPASVAPAAPGLSGSDGVTIDAQSVAVLPFVDLTEGMAHEEFADGVSQEISDRLTAVPGYRVPAPASTFVYKNKDVPVADIARALRVRYVVDGSVRRSGSTVRVAARLIRADNADVVWSQSYDRPWGDVLQLQDDIAGTATAAIARSIAAGVARP